MRYRLDVVAPNAVDVVRHAGGWLYDRAMAGWDVTVLVGEDIDERPLHVLGARTLDIETALGTWMDRQRPQTIAVAADVFEADARIREGVLKAIEHGSTEVTLWGESCPADLHRTVDVVQHELSAAARAFKAHALTAAGLPVDGAVGAVEVFRCGTMECPSVAADLVPAS